jgi:hypothetical protein
MRKTIRLGFKVTLRALVAAVLLLAAGIAIAYVDTRPGWDDTGVTAGLLAGACGLAALAGVSPFLAPILGAAPLVIAEIRQGRGVLLAIPIAIGGAVAGAIIRRIARPPEA